MNPNSTNADFFIAQLTPDVFRKEAINIGVIVSKNKNIASRFFGERVVNGEIDRRKIRRFAHTDAYVLWVEYWRSVFVTSPDPVKALLEHKSANYNIINGGKVSNTDADSVEDIANYLYPLLVSEGGLRESLGLNEEVTTEVAIEKLRRSVDDILRDNDLLGAGEGGFFSKKYKHPIIKGREVHGKTVESHKPTYVQENGSLWVMETIDFTPKKKEVARDTAGCAAYIFNDIKDGNSPRIKVKPIAIVRMLSDDLDDPEVKYGLDMLKGAEADLVYWHDQHSRTKFIQERIIIAESLPA